MEGRPCVPMVRGGVARISRGGNAGQSCDSDAGWHVHEDGLRMSDGTSSSLAVGRYLCGSADIAPTTS